MYIPANYTWNKTASSERILMVYNCVVISIILKGYFFISICGTCLCAAVCCYIMIPETFRNVKSSKHWESHLTSQSVEKQLHIYAVLERWSSSGQLLSWRLHPVIHSRNDDLLQIQYTEPVWARRKLKVKLFFEISLKCVSLVVTSNSTYFIPSNQLFFLQKMPA